MKKAVARDREVWMREGLEAGASSKTAWSKAQTLPGQTQHTNPINIKTDSGSWETNPLKFSNMFAKHFKKKLVDMRTQCRDSPTIEPRTRLKAWLDR